MTGVMSLDEDRCYQALLSRDTRFDGQFIAGITSTGIYCRASCPAPVRPKRANVRVFATAAAAQSAGFRSCKRCRPDASPGSPEWDRRGDLVGRAMRLIEAGEVDRVGVSGLADALHVSARHLHRLLTETVGASPVALARAHRANLARILLETTDMSVTDVAYAAGFSSIRQYNDAIRAIYDRTPSEIRRARRSDRPSPADDGTIALTVRLPYRAPLAIAELVDTLARYGTPGVSTVVDGCYERVLRLDGGPGHARVAPADGGLSADFALSALSDLAPAIAAIRRLCDLDADPIRIAGHFAGDPIIGDIMARQSGVRVPGSVDGFETAVSVVLAQQVSLAGSRTLLGRLVERFGEPYEHDRVAHVFPSAATIADADLGGLGLTERRQTTIRAIARGLLAGRLDLTPSADRVEQRRALLDIPGIGPWTTDVLSMRVLRDPDVLLVDDLLIARRLRVLDADDEHRQRWSPWRSYVTSALRTDTESESP